MLLLFSASLPMGTSMITGAHSIIYSTNAEADRAFLRDVLRFPNVDVGDGWLIFGLPPSEVAVHPSDKNNEHEFYLMCDDVRSISRERLSKRLGTLTGRSMSLAEDSLRILIAL